MSYFLTFAFLFIYKAEKAPKNLLRIQIKKDIKMSFDMTPSMNLSNVQASAKSCPGGGGNTGYFKRNNDEEEENFFKSKQYPDDSFEKQELILEDVEDDEPLWLTLRNLISEIIKTIKNIFKKQS